MDVILPDGRIIKDVPEGTSKGELALKLWQNDVIDHAEFVGLAPVAAFNEDIGPGEAFVVSVGRGVKDVMEGAHQLRLEVGDYLGLVDPKTVQHFNKMAMRERKLYDKYADFGAIGTVGRITGNVMTTAIPAAGIGKIATVARYAPAVGRSLARFGRTVAATRTGRVAASAGAGAVGGAATFVPPGGSRLENSAFGAVAGAVLQPVVSKLSRRLQKIPRALTARSIANRRKGEALKAFKGQLPADELRRVVNDVAEGLTPEQALRKNDIERIGGTATRGRVSGNVSDTTFEERVGRRAMETPSPDAEHLQNIIQGNKQTVLAHADRLASKFAPAAARDPEAAGVRAFQTLSGAKEATRKNVVSPAYERAGENLQQFASNVRLNTENMANALRDELDNIKDPNLAPVRSVLQEFGVLKKAQGSGVLVLNDQAHLSAKQAESLRRRLSKIQGANPSRVANIAIRGLEKDVADTYGEDLYAAARKLTKEQFFDRFVNPARVNALIQGDVAPEKLVQKMQGWSAFEAKQFMHVLDGVDTDAANSIRGAFLQNVTDSLESTVLDAQGTPELNAATFNKLVKRIGDAKFDAVFGKGTTQDIKRFVRSIQTLTSVDRRAAGSPTANNLVNMVQGAGFALQSKSPILGSLIITFGRIFGGLADSAGEAARIRKAIDLSLLKKEQRLADINAQRVSPGGSATAGHLGAQAAPAILERINQLLAGP